MKNRLKRAAALLCLILTVPGALAPIATALSGNVAGITNAVAAPEHELSVMSFNILDTVDDTRYASPAERAPLAVKTILKYEPDLLGIQEAGDYTYSGDFDWNDYLVQALAPHGYDCRYLTQEPVHPTNMTIAAGLMIFYKRERFDLIDHGSAQYRTDGHNGVYATFEGFYRTDGSRYYHWVKLWDKVQKTYVFQFNTHLAVPTGSLTQGGKTATSEQRTMLANITRTISARQLADAMEKMAGNYPCFATGDYNASWSRSVKDDANQSQLYELTENGIFSAAVDDASSRISVSPTGIIDHVFYNRFQAQPLTYRGIYEEYGGYQPSDHLAMMAYFNLTPPVSFGSGSFDRTARTLTDSTAETSYTFEITGLHESLRAEIYDQDGQRVTGAAELTRTYNRFLIKLFNSTATGSAETPYCTVSATIQCTANLPVQISAAGAKNIYYADGAWHILLPEGVTTLTPSCTDGVFYSDAAATRQQALPLPLTDPTTLCYLRTASGDEIFPVYIHRETAAAEEGKVLYVDDGIGTASGTVAFATDDKVIAVEAGVNGFGTLAAAAAVANTADGYTVYIAPGHYKSGAVTFSKNVTLLGNNHDISPLVRTDAEFTLSADRRSETVIDAQLNFTRASAVFTVRGFTFVGNGSNAYAICQTHSNTKNTVFSDIQKNIFRFSGNNTTNSSCIMFNTTSKNDGVIADNYFEMENERAATLCRVLTTRNPYGLRFENNYCVNFTDQLFFLSSETYHGSTEAGNFVLTMRYNRFDNCRAADFYIQHTNETSKVDLQVLYNDFVACDNHSSLFALRIFTSAAGGVVTDYSKMNINLFGNRFIGCRRSIYMRTGADEGDPAQATIRINQNRIIGMQQGRKDAIQLYFDVYRDEQINATSPNWDFSHNYFTSDTVSGHHPDTFVNTNFTYNGEAVSSVDRSLFLPYYTNPELTWLSEGVIKTQGGITITDNRHAYDGKPHSLTINAGEGAVISYSTDPSEDRFYSQNKPTLTEPGTLYVYYQIERKGYKNFTGRALITVTMPQRTITMADMTIPYDGQTHSLLPVYTPMEGDRVSYTFNGVTYEDMPAFIGAGSYSVTVTVENDFAKTITATATLTITAGEIRGVTLNITDDIVLGGLQTGDTVVYSVDNGAPTTRKPTLSGNERTVTVTVSRAGHNDLVLVALITKAHPFTLQLTKSVEGEKILWNMSISADTKALLTENITLLSYGTVTADTAEKILGGKGTLAPLAENETGLLTLAADLSFTADASTPTAVYATYVKDGAVYTIYSTVGVK